MTDFDPAKDLLNLKNHRISLKRWRDLVQLVVMEDRRFDYGERRFLAYGTLDRKNYCLVFTERDGNVRPISLRRVHLKEMRRYVPNAT